MAGTELDRKGAECSAGERIAVSIKFARPFYQEDLPGSIFLPCWPNGSAGPTTARFEEGLAVSSQTMNEHGQLLQVTQPVISRKPLQIEHPRQHAPHVKSVHLC